MKTPFNLDSGLYLEKSSTLLPWGSTVDELSRLGCPEVYRHPSTTNIGWLNEAVFEGLPVRIDMQGAAGPNAFYLTKATAAASAKDEYAELLADLTMRLGPPHSTVTESGYPWSRWAWGNVVISLRIAERFTEYVALMASKGLVHV